MTARKPDTAFPGLPTMIPPGNPLLSRPTACVQHQERRTPCGKSRERRVAASRRRSEPQGVRSRMPGKNAVWFSYPFKIGNRVADRTAMLEFMLCPCCSVSTVDSQTLTLYNKINRKN